MWACCQSDERRQYFTALNRAFRRMLAEGVELPTHEQVEQDIDAVLDRPCVDRTPSRSRDANEDAHPGEVAGTSMISSISET
jgi:hypothetical protein